jgi:uncharacterized protein Yka (UPF0111/DUF47 family)
MDALFDNVYTAIEECKVQSQAHARKRFRKYEELCSLIKELEKLHNTTREKSVDSD